MMSSRLGRTSGAFSIAGSKHVIVGGAICVGIILFRLATGSYESCWI